MYGRKRLVIKTEPVIERQTLIFRGFRKQASWICASGSRSSQTHGAVAEPVGGEQPTYRAVLVAIWWQI